MDHVADRAPQGWRVEHELTEASDQETLEFSPPSDSEGVDSTARSSLRGRSAHLPGVRMEDDRHRGHPGSGRDKADPSSPHQDWSCAAWTGRVRSELNRAPPPAVATGDGPINLRPRGNLRALPFALFRPMWLRLPLRTTSSPPVRAPMQSTGRLHSNRSSVSGLFPAFGEVYRVHFCYQ